MKNEKADSKVQSKNYTREAFGVRKPSFAFIAALMQQQKVTKIMIENKSRGKINDKNDITIKTITEEKERPLFNNFFIVFIVLSFLSLILS